MSPDPAGRPGRRGGRGRSGGGRVGGGRAGGRAPGGFWSSRLLFWWWAASQVFVGGLPKTATDQTIMQTFSQYGPVSRVDLKYDEWGSSKGFAFVYFQDAVAG
jgi:hypothetical protein